MRARLGIVAIITANTAMAGIPSGEVIEDAITVDLAPEAFDLAEEMALGFIPPEIAIPEFSDFPPDFCLWSYGIRIRDLVAEIEMLDMDIRPESGALVAEGLASIWVNDPSRPFELYTELLCIGETCNGWITPFTVSFDAIIYVDIVDNGVDLPYLAATVGDIIVDYSLNGDNIALETCTIGGLEDFFNFFGGSLYDLILPIADDAITTAIDDLVPELETSINEIFTELKFEDELEVMEGVSLGILMYPGDVMIENEGMRISMDGALWAPEANICVEDWDPGESLHTPSDWPTLGSGAATVDPSWHAGIHISDDFGNQALYAAWLGGLLCFELDAETIPIPLDTSLLGLIGGDAYDDLFPVPAKLGLGLFPVEPPLMDLDSDNDLGIHIEDMGLDFSAELDYRQARILGLELDIDLGVDVPFDGVTGILEVVIDMGADDMVTYVNHNDLAPAATGDIEDSVGSVFGSLMGTMIGGLIGDSLAMTLPSFDLGTGILIGLTDMDFGIAGPEEDWIGAYAWVGEVPYQNEFGCGDTAGCDEGSGCEDTAGCTDPSNCDDLSGCSSGEAGGCDTTGCTSGTGSCQDATASSCTITGAAIPARLVPVIMSLFVIARRRREEPRG